MEPTGDVLARWPWREVPVLFADVLRPRVEEIASEMQATIRHEVRVYRQPEHSAVGRDVSAAVHCALRQFVELTENPDSPQGHHELFFQRLGRLEYLNGRTTDGIQAAYRVGARVACRHYVRLAHAASLPPETALPVTEAVLAHISALSDLAVRGYAAARAHAAGQTQRSRRALAARLLEQSAMPRTEPLSALAEQAKWPLPESVACLVMGRAGGGGHVLAAAGLDEDVLVLPQGGELLLVVPDPEDGGRLDRLRAAVREYAAALGPTVALDEAWLSAYCARLALRHRSDLGAPADVPLVAAEHLLDLHLLSGAHMGRLMADRLTEALRALPPGKAARLADTLEALLTSWGRTAPEVAEALGVHPQTVRKRLRQLDQLYGERLGDPAFRTGALLALRTRALTRQR
ncbi:helix-turn-helix domain-containing protein [Streptomyces daliensis]|uniref:Helix-turn-helix domain-containing protein n=1 Tax=Streptomyces daliensis TaxID=299421 RepID=A0A8T4IQ32_9ACTN|nr:helix-turn-helix domain-containing protein [Streptomyces daliensis]